jgi:hypothetical protein
MPEQPVGGFRRFRGGGEDSFLVVLEDFEPVGDVLRMVSAGLRGDAKVPAQERSTEFGDQFFCGVALRAEAAGKIAVEAFLPTRPVRVMPISA